MEKWGYVRVSVDKVTQAAGWQDQINRLQEAGCSKWYYEEASTRNERPVFERMQNEAIRHAAIHGPVTLVASKLDRAFRDMGTANAAIKDMPALKVYWTLLDLQEKPIDPSDPSQMLLANVVSSIAQFERDRLAERRAYGIAKAKAEGKYKGRKPTARAKTDEVAAFRDRGFKPEEIAKQVGISRASVFRILKTLRSRMPPDGGDQ